MSEARILRVFPRRTAMTPDDEFAFVGDPPLPGMRPPPEEVDEIHVSVAFTWDVEAAARLLLAWNDIYPGKRFEIGGPALDRPPSESFVPGRYLKRGVTITTRGCPNRCLWCLVHPREGGFRELSPVPEGWIVQDNNLLAASRRHLNRVFEMLARQPKRAVFSGGLEPRRLTPPHARLIRELRPADIFLSFDSGGPAVHRALERAVGRLREAGNPATHISCYVLIGRGDDTPANAERRLRFVLGLGIRPFAMLYHGPDGKRPAGWGSFQREWCRPQIVRAKAKEAAT